MAFSEYRGAIETRRAPARKGQGRLFRAQFEM
jgi:hypothetical protein